MKTATVASVKGESTAFMSPLCCKTWATGGLIRARRLCSISMLVLPPRWELCDIPRTFSLTTTTSILPASTVSMGRLGSPLHQARAASCSSQGGFVTFWLRHMASQRQRSPARSWNPYLDCQKFEETPETLISLPIMGAAYPIEHDVDCCECKSP